MEDYYYYFTVSMETTAEINTSFLVKHTCSRKRSSMLPTPRRVPSRDDDTDKLVRHYLDACCMCARILSGNRDIFMCRGDTPFCSEECRQEQIDIDEVAEKRSKQSAAAAWEQQRQQQNLHRLPIWAR